MRYANLNFLKNTGTDPLEKQLDLLLQFSPFAWPETTSLHE